jgi:hypothetical protein
MTTLTINQQGHHYEVHVNGKKQTDIVWQRCPEKGTVNSVSTYIYQAFDTYGGKRYVHGNEKLFNAANSRWGPVEAHKIWDDGERKFKKYYFEFNGTWYKVQIDSKTGTKQILNVTTKLEDSSLFRQLIIPAFYFAPVFNDCEVYPSVLVHSPAIVIGF